MALKICQYECALPFAMTNDSKKRTPYTKPNDLRRCERIDRVVYKPLEDLCLHSKLRKMFPTVFVACADDGIGRFDTSQQSLMELFIFGLHKAEDICGSRDDPAEVCTWKGVECNADGEVASFGWVSNFFHGAGTIGVQFLPCSLKHLCMCMNSLTGTIELGDLPEHIIDLLLYSNSLSGTLNLDGLPADMQNLLLSENTFTGEISLKSLPKCLQQLRLGMNKLKGTICLTSLP